MLGPHARSTSPFARFGAAVVVGALLLVGCGSTSTTGSTDASDTIRGSITVDAAASLQGAFTELRRAFLVAHPSAGITLNFAASSALAQQLVAGAPVDVFASADEANMDKVDRADLLAQAPTTFATNSLQIIVRKGNPSNITSLNDLARPGLVVISCSPEVPIGKYAASALSRAGVSVKFASLEPDVKGIVTKVTSGEADAGIVYSTDVLATKGAATGITIPKDFDVVANYPIAALRSSKDPTTASAWIEFVTGPEGRAILGSFGFGAP